MKLRLHGAEQLVQVVSNGSLFLKGQSMREIAILRAKPLPTELPPSQKDGLTVIVNE